MTKKTCEDCACLIEKNGVWCCDECFGQPIAEIDDCPEGVTEEVISDIEKHAKENKVKIVNTSDKKERKPRERKADEDKRTLIKAIYENAILDLDPTSCILNVEREITFDYNGENYSITLTKHRKKK